MTGALIALVGLILAGTPVSADSSGSAQPAVDPPNETDHGVNETTFQALWSGDDDATDSAALVDDENTSQMAALAAYTDIPFNSPPRAVEQWNSGDHQEFPETSLTESIHPSNVSLQDGRFVKDAYVDVFAVQPSTRARLSQNNQPLYVAPNGSVLATLDYRVDVPDETRSDDRRSVWSLDGHQIGETRLLVDGEVETTQQGSHTPTLEYTALDSYTGTNHTLTIETDITVTLRHRESVCVEDNDTTTETNQTGDDDNDDNACEDWETSVTYPTETLTVSTSRAVSVYDLRVSGYRARYPDGDLGVVAYKNQPWAGYSLPGGSVQGVWRFYSARDTDWDQLIQQTANGSKRVRSPLQPLQVAAYPSETGPTASQRGRIEILDTYGQDTVPPTLPENLELDIVTDPYTASYGIATRATIEDPNRTQLIDSNVTAHGLVRSVSANVTDDSFATIPINESNLTLTVTNVTDETVTATVTLRDDETGDPIATEGREGAVVLNGERVQTDENGTVTRTLPRPAGGVSARYEPGQWWLHPTSYTADSDTAYVRGTVLHLVSSFYQIVVPILTVCIAVYILDRLTGWQIWPPWRGM